jgi:hypothetical protein
MIYQISEPIKLRTSKGEVELRKGQTVTLPCNVALKLLNEGRIIPVGRVAYKVYSDILQAYLWVVADERDVKALRASDDIAGAIYTGTEIEKLKAVPKEGLKIIHKVKELFPEAIVQEVVRLNYEHE